MQQLEELDIKVAILAGLFLTALYYFVLFDDGSKLKTITAGVTADIERKKSTLDSINNAIDNKKSFDQEAEEINTNIRSFMEFFPEDMDQNNFMKSISKAAEDNASTVVSLKPKAKASEFPAYPEMAFEFTIEGGYHNIMKFISDLTLLKRAIDLRETTLKVVAQEKIPRVSLATTLIVYGHIPQPEDKGKKKKPGGA